MIRSYYRRLLSKIVLRSLPSDFNWTESCPMVRFDSFGQSTEILFRFLFFTSDIYCGDGLLGCFYGRSLGFWGATNCVCRVGSGRIKFKNASGGVRAVNARTSESLLLKTPQHRFSSRFLGRIAVCLPDKSEMAIEFPKVICMSQSGLPAYARFVFEDGLSVRVLLYGRESSDSEKVRNLCFNKAVHPDDVEKLRLAQVRISMPMLLALAMYSRMYMKTRWLIG